MSEVKGTLLGIVLVVSAFALVFGIITLAMRQSANTVAGRISDASEMEPAIQGQVSTAYTLHY